MEELLENVPAAHSLHVELESAPGTLEYWPAVHETHDVAAPSEYLPAAHSLHVELEAAPVALENLPGTHSRHTEEEMAGHAQEESQERPQ